MTTTHRLSINAVIDDLDAPGDVIDVLALDAFVAGAEPFARTVRLQRVRADATLLPPGSQPTRVAEDMGHRAVLARGTDWTLRALRWRDETAVLTVTGATDAVVARIIGEATDGACAPEPDADDEVTVGFWHRGPRGAERVARTVDVTPWDQIRGNYPTEVAAALGRLMAVDADGLDGRLVLLHGPAGTGKTTALRALAHAWRPWCQLDVVVDPEVLLNDASYLTHLVLGDDELAEPPRWRLLVLEDCDELVRADAKQGTGQALSRLLNLTDGFIGQGLDVLVCVTTNERLDRLHPAIARPGRCLAEIHVGPFPIAEAAAWLGRPVAVGEEMTLAQLYARRGDIEKVERAEPTASLGQYL